MRQIVISLKLFATLPITHLVWVAWLCTLLESVYFFNNNAQVTSTLPYTYHAKKTGYKFLKIIKRSVPTVVQELSAKYTGQEHFCLPEHGIDPKTRAQANEEPALLGDGFQLCMLSAHFCLKMDASDTPNSSVPYKCAEMQ